MKYRLTRGMLVANTWKEKGEVIDADGSYAQQLVKYGAAVPVGGPGSAGVETATDPAQEKAERADHPRQAHPHGKK